MAPELQRTTAITVAEALELPALQRGLPEVLAGAGRLGSPIRWVHAGEVPNIASLLVGGELLLTTGMGFGGAVAQSRRFVADLAQRGVAALVVELGSALQAVPDGMREAAAEVDLPLVVLHREVAFVRVTEAIHTELVNRQYGLLREGEEIRQRLISVMLEGDGLAELLRTVSAIVGNPVFLETAAGRLLFHAGRDDDLEAWQGARERPDAGLEQTVPMGPGSAAGRLAILPTRRRPTELDAIALGHAAGIVALALLRAREEDELVVRQRGNLLTELADGTVSAVHASRQAERMGFRPRSSLLLAVAVDESPPSPSPTRAALLGDLERELEGRAVPLISGARAGDGPLLALASVPETDGSDARATTAGLVAEVVARVWERRRPGTRAVLGVDGPVGWADAGRALRVAAQTAAAATSLPARPWFDGRELELDRLLWGMRAEGALEEFVARNLGPLLHHDRERRLALLPTLEVLCHQGGRKAEAARSLHLHRQALYHRISRIEALLGCDLSDPVRLTTLHVALRALPYTALGGASVSAPR